MNNCPFCNHAASSLWLGSATVLAFWDGFPVSEGHTLVIPRLHVASLFELPALGLAAVWEFVARVRTELAMRFHVYGELFLDFARRVGLREVVGRYLNSGGDNVLAFDDFRNLVINESDFDNDIIQVANTRGL